jgi:hypothetical protein
MYSEVKRNAIDAQSAKPFLVLTAAPRVCRPYRAEDMAPALLPVCITARPEAPAVAHPPVSWRDKE